MEIYVVFAGSLRKLVSSLIISCIGFYLIKAFFYFLWRKSRSLMDCWNPRDLVSKLRLLALLQIWKSRFLWDLIFQLRSEIRSRFNRFLLGYSSSSFYLHSIVWFSFFSFTKKLLLSVSSLIKLFHGCGNLRFLCRWRQHQERRPVQRALEFQAPPFPAVVIETHGQANLIGEECFVREATVAQGIRGRDGLNLERGHGWMGYSSQGRRGNFRGVSISDRGLSYHRKQSEPSSHDSGVMPRSDPEASALVNPKVGGTVTSSDILPDNVNSGVLEGSFLPLADAGGEENPNFLGNNPKFSNVTNLLLVDDAQMDVGEFQEGCVENEFDGELEDFGDFNGDLEFVIGDDFGEEFGDDEMNFQENATKEKPAIEVDMADVEIASYDVGIVKDTLVGENPSGDSDLVSDEKVTRDNDSVIDKEMQAKKYGKKKQVRGSGILVGVNSKMRNVALLSSPRRKIPPKSGVEVKDGGKNKDGKVALLKLPGSP